MITAGRPLLVGGTMTTTGPATLEEMTHTGLEARPPAEPAITAPGTPEARTIPPGTNPAVAMTTPAIPELPRATAMMTIPAEPKKVFIRHSLPVTPTW